MYAFTKCSVASSVAEGAQMLCEVVSEEWRVNFGFLSHLKNAPLSAPSLQLLDWESIVFELLRQQLECVREALPQASRTPSF